MGLQCIYTFPGNTATRGMLSKNNTEQRYLYRSNIVSLFVYVSNIHGCMFYRTGSPRVHVTALYTTRMHACVFFLCDKATAGIIIPVVHCNRLGLSETFMYTYRCNKKSVSHFIVIVYGPYIVNLLTGSTISGYTFPT